MQMVGHGEKLTRTKEKAIAALLVQPTIGDAAKAAGVGENTLWRWLRLDGFKTAYRDAKREVVNQAIALVQAGMSEAVETLRDVMTDCDAPASARVSAAKAMIDVGLKASEIESIENRIVELEKQIKKSKGYK